MGSAKGNGTPISVMVDLGVSLSLRMACMKALQRCIGRMAICAGKAITRQESIVGNGSGMTSKASCCGWSITPNKPQFFFLSFQLNRFMPKVNSA